MAQQQFYCTKCFKTLNADQFYGSNNLQKYPEGKLDKCKKCITMHVDNWDPETYTWIMEECDVPYVPAEWNKLMATYAKDATKVTGSTIIGRYLAKMKLKQHKDYRWKDTEFLQELENSKLEQTMKRQGYDIQEITMAIEQNKNMPPPVEKPAEAEPADYFGSLNNIPEVELDLSEEDKIYLSLKWGRQYRPEEWVSLEQLYDQMMQSYDIQSAGDVNTLKLACKCSLKANQLLDIGDMEGSAKATKMYGDLMKAGKWTAQQIKEDGNDVIDSIGALVAICETEGFIPRYYVDSPQDKVDRVIEDLKHYTHELIINETGIGTMIESALKQIEEENQQVKNDNDDEDISDDAALMNYDIPVIEDSDFAEFSEFEDDLAQSDEDLINSIWEEVED